VKAVWNLGLSHLLIGDYERGWPMFEKRIELGEVAVDDYSQPRWVGTSLEGKTLLVHSEQGIGDEILFASCYPEVIPQVEKCVIVCDTRLETIFRRSFPAATVYGFTRRKDGTGMKFNERIDWQVPAGSLPMMVRRSREEFPQRQAFLLPDPELIQFWKARFESLGAGLKIGISWRAGGKPQERRKRMIPLEQWSEILTTPGCHFINLQYSDSSEEVAQVGKELGIKIHDWEEGDPLVDMDSFGAKIKALDLVISVGNATVHMAGAVGTPAWTLLPMVPSWRWMVRGEQSPWYASVQLFRQPERGDWETVLREVAGRLRSRVGAPMASGKRTIAKPQADRGVSGHGEAGAETWLEPKEIMTEVMIESIGTSLEEAEKCMVAEEFERAEALYRDVLQIAPRHFQALHGLGLVARRTGRLDLAIRSFQRSLATVGGVATHRFNYAGALAEARRFEEAAAEYLRTLELDPSITLARVELGRVLQIMGDHEQALTQFGKASLQGAKNPDLLVFRGVSLASQCRIDEAIESFEQALRIKPSHLPALGALADVYLEDQQYEDAERCLRRAIAIRSDIATWHALLGRVLRRDDRPLEAVEHLQRAAELDPQDVTILNDLGTLHREMAEPQQAATYFERALELAPRRPELLNSLGLVLAEQGKFEAAMSRYDEALAIQPDYATAHVNRAFTLLHQGKLGEGWREYSWRWKAPNAPRPRMIGLPSWRGESLSKKTILIHGEQGVGDEIMFASCYGDVIRRAEHAVLVCQPRLEQLFRRSFAEATILPVPRGQESSWRLPAGLSADVQIAGASIPEILRTKLEDFSNQSFLRPDAGKVDHWKSRFAALGAGLKIGISWRAGETRLDRILRGESLEPWKPFLSTAGFHFVNLQYGDTREELHDFERETGVTVHHWADADNTSDLDGLAARMAALDLVISVGNANVHLAGSIGSPCWALLPHVAGWRWIEREGASVWYPSVRLFRQIRSGDWGELFDRVGRELLNRPSSGVEESKRSVVVAPHLGVPRGVGAGVGRPQV
jgi:tetratricopeptide (TPR) repeat protein/ADP-heptose:LPS heptosyltransferase